MTVFHQKVGGGWNYAASRKFGFGWRSCAYRKQVLIGMALLSPFFVGAADSASPAAGTIFPAKDAPQWLKRQWEEVVRCAQFKMPPRNWKDVGLPEGLEEQVWEAWAPGAPHRWKSIGPGYLNVAWYDQKVDNGVISLLLDLGGLIQSKDGGRTWRVLSHHLTSSQYYTFDISPADPKVIAIGGVHIDRSLNGGRSWSPVVDPVLPSFKSLPVIPGNRHQAGQVVYGAIRFNADGSRVFASPGAFGHGYGGRYGIEPEMHSWLKRKYIYAGDGQVSHFKAIDLGPFAGVRCMLPHFSNPDLFYVSYSDGSIYVCRNARAATPVFTELKRPDSLKHFQAIGMDVSPDDPDTLLLCLLGQHSRQNNVAADCPSKLVLAHVSGTALSCREIDTGTFKRISSAKWNPHRPQQILAGQRGGNSILVSDDGMKTFKVVDVLSRILSPVHTTGYRGTNKITFDRNSDLAVMNSVTGAWGSRDQFKTLENLAMVDGNADRYCGNKGVAFPECAQTFIRKSCTYIASIDHGVWRSEGQDTSKWRKLSDHPGMPRLGYHRLAFPMGVSEDESYIYLAARLDDWSSGNHKLVLSRDRGESWKDVTALLGLGEVVKGGIQKIWFDPSDSNRQWILADQGRKLFFSQDGGTHFRSSSIPAFRDIVWDALHKKLYAASGRGLFRSQDFGLTWTRLSILTTSCYGIAVLANGDLVVSDDGRLMVIPYAGIDGAVIEPSMIRLTAGSTMAEAACGRRTFRPIVCDGMNILTFTDDGWNRSNCNRDLGPLLSRDGGKTFQWIAYDLPSFGKLAEMRHGKVMIGGRGLYELDLNVVPTKKSR